MTEVDAIFLEQPVTTHTHTHMRARAQTHAAVILLLCQRKRERERQRETDRQRDRERQRQRQRELYDLYTLEVLFIISTKKWLFLLLVCVPLLVRNRVRCLYMHPFDCFDV